MAPSYEQAHLAKAVMSYMGHVSEQQHSNQDKKIARSPELKNFLLYLSNKVPSVMDKVLKSVSSKCGEALRAEKEAQNARKRSEPLNHNESIAKRVKCASATEGNNALQSAVEDGGDDPMEEGSSSPVDSRSSEMTLPLTSNANKDRASRSKESKKFPNTKPEVKRLSNTAISVCGHQEGHTVDLPPAYEIEFGSSTGSQSSQTTLPRTSSSDRDEDMNCEGSEEESPIAKPGEKNLSDTATTSAHGDREGETIFVPTAYDIDSGLSSASVDIEDYVKASLLSLKPSMTRPNFNIQNEINKVWKIVLLLDFFKTRRELHQYLENREKMPGEKLQARINWEISNPSKIIDTLDNVRKNTIDNKIHRAYGQTMLFFSVNTQVDVGYKSTATGHRSDHSALLEDLAREKAGPVSKAEVDQTIASYLNEYHAGQKWLAVIDWFGGSGIVLIFVIAGK